MIKISNIDQVKESLKGFLDGLNRLSFTSDVTQEVQENVRDSHDPSSDRNEAFREAVYQSHLKHDDVGMKDAIKNLPKGDRQRDKVEDDLIDKYIMDYLNQIFSEV